MGAFSTSYTLTKESWAVLMGDKEMVLMPIYATLLTVLLTGLAGAGYYAAAGMLPGMPSDTVGQVAYVVLLYIYMVVVYFIGNYYSAGLLLMAHARFNNQTLSPREALRQVGPLRGKLLGWSLVCATVGLLLSLLKGKNGKGGAGRAIAASLFGAAWDVMTYFSLPALVVGGATVWGSFSDSASTIKRTWGEAAITNLGVGSFFALLIGLGVAVTAGLWMIGGSVVALPAIGLLILYVVALSILSSTLGVIIKLALYEYAHTGKLPDALADGLTPWVPPSLSVGTMPASSVVPAATFVSAQPAAPSMPAEDIVPTPPPATGPLIPSAPIAEDIDNEISH